MDIKETPVQVIRRRWLCPGYHCDGEMFATGLGCEHKCMACGQVLVSHEGNTYPYIAFIDDPAP